MRSTEYSAVYGVFVGALLAGMWACGEHGCFDTSGCQTFLGPGCFFWQPVKPAILADGKMLARRRTSQHQCQPQRGETRRPFPWGRRLGTPPSSLPPENSGGSGAWGRGPDIMTICTRHPKNLAPLANSSGAEPASEPLLRSLPAFVITCILRTPYLHFHVQARSPIASLPRLN